MAAERTSRLAAGLYLAFAPAFVTRYSLSNDGNYVEVLALGSAALLAVAAWSGVAHARARCPSSPASCSGLAFWCHILAVIPAAAVGIVAFTAGRPAIARRPEDGFRRRPRLRARAALERRQRLGVVRATCCRGAATDGGVGRTGLLGRCRRVLADHAVVLAGYDHGYDGIVDAALRVAAVATLAAAAWALTVARRAVAGSPALSGVLVLAAVNALVALIVLPYIPGNPRYLLVRPHPRRARRAPRRGEDRARAVRRHRASWAWPARGRRRPGTIRSDGEWRRFVAALEAEGVRWCYTDFYLATKINFLSGERVVCSSKLGPTTTEYFFDYRDLVDAAPAAAFVAVNPTAAEKLERRLDRLGVKYERRDLMKPVLLRLSRKVDPAEIFPDREFPLR